MKAVHSRSLLSHSPLRRSHSHSSKHTQPLVDDAVKRLQTRLNHIQNLNLTLTK